MNIKFCIKLTTAATETHKMLEAFMEIKLYLTHMYLNCLKHSEMNVKTITMFNVWAHRSALISHPL